MADRKQSTPAVTRLADYQPPAFWIDGTALTFALDEALTRVTARLSVRRNPQSAHPHLVLDGDELSLMSVHLDGRALSIGTAQQQYEVSESRLTVYDVPDQFELQTVVEIQPSRNTALMGLYVSEDILCTQCEAEGFRRITYYLDRPDVLSEFTVTLLADSGRFPVLLCNGNLVETSTDEGKAKVVWHDPWPKPSYLFALVAGKLEFIEDTFTTRSNKKVALRVYTQPHNIDKCDHAMASLIQSMRWDEEVYGREYDLDIFNVVAVDDFNMGAMENKSLNIFNSKYVLAKPETATDADYDGITGVIGHEYFHNWSGNRVTCRDWFQLSLKEGFTVFRDQEFSADVTSRGVKRIEDVNVLRSHQFKEDAGPTAHPVRPDSYVEINNFYTATVYNKGAEVVRMLHGLVGQQGFRKGTDLYFDRFDGQAVTIEDFTHAMEQANGVDLAQFRLWYSQAGTPRVTVSREFDETSGDYTMTFTQSCPDTPGQKDKAPFHIPVVMALLDTQGALLPLHCEHDNVIAGDAENTMVLALRDTTETFVFKHLDAKPVPSLLRGFSAPVILHADLDDRELSFLMANDNDPFNRWDAGQRLVIRQALQLVDQYRQRQTLSVEDVVIDAWASTLSAEIEDVAFQAKALTLPSESLIGEQMETIDVEAVAVARDHLKQCIGEALHERWMDRYRALDSGQTFTIDPLSQGRRALKNLCLQFCASHHNAKYRASIESLALAQLKHATNMTDELGALMVLVHYGFVSSTQALDDFLRRWCDEALVVDKWFAIQAMNPDPATLSSVIQLTNHAMFVKTNPNRVRALIGSFAVGNQRGFHAADGSGYRFVADWVIELDAFNPQIAARLATSFSSWRRFDSQRQTLMREQLERMLAAPSVSPDVGEIVGKSLGHAAGA